MPSACGCSTSTASTTCSATAASACSPRPATRGAAPTPLSPPPAPTPGPPSVLVRPAAGPVLLAGDAAYTRRSIDEQILPALTVDEAAYRRSLAWLKDFSEREPEALIVPT